MIILMQNICWKMRNENFISVNMLNKCQKFWERIEIGLKTLN